MTWTQTHRGVRFDIFNLRAEDIFVEDIAHHLSQINRFGGATPFPYSVAQHSVIVSNMCSADNAMHGLLHDAAEAYIGDLPSPWKDLVRIAGDRIVDIEEEIMEVIYERLKLPLPDLDASLDVHKCDRAACAVERVALMPSVLDWGIIDTIDTPPTWLRMIKRMASEDAKELFLERFRDLTL
jgi:uncharacterized protein